jgi:hypothetical protein
MNIQEEAQSLPLSCAVDKNVWRRTPTPRLDFITWGVIRHRENFQNQNQIEDYCFLMCEAM